MGASPYGFFESFSYLCYFFYSYSSCFFDVKCMPSHDSSQSSNELKVSTWCQLDKFVSNIGRDRLSDVKDPDLPVSLSILDVLSFDTDISTQVAWMRKLWI